MNLPSGILRIASLLVPGSKRGEWLEDWHSELWYVRRNPISFSLGAFRDALWIRRQCPDRPADAFRLQTPAQCLAFLATLAAISLFFAFRLPLPRALLLPSPYKNAESLVMISTGHAKSVQEPTIPSQEYRSLQEDMPYRFSDLAFYRPERVGRFSLAYCSQNLFDLLQIPIASPSGSRLVLTTSIWRSRFHGDPHMLGRTVTWAGHTAVVAGIIPENSWVLPGKIDAWLLNDRPAGGNGFLLGRLRFPGPLAQQWNYQKYQCTSLAKEKVLPAYLFIFLLSFLILCTTTTLSLGEYPANRAVRVRRWLFLGLKIALLIPVVCCGSLDLASLLGTTFQPHGLLIGLIVGMRWALVDQRRRCPVCLRLLSNPTRIGGPSHVFLDWYGTELICAQGHGLLYVPEIATSCYSTQRWQYLDASWSTLF